MSKKSLFFGSTVLLIAMLFTLAGCDNPAGPEGPRGEDGTGGLQGIQGDEVKGPDGEFGGYRLSGAVQPVDLEQAFLRDDVVILQANVASVYGEVPGGKTLIVLGNTPVLAGRTLTLKDGAVLNVNTGATLRAAGITPGSGLLVSEAGAVPEVTGAGRIFLPAVQSGEHDGFLHWESDTVNVALQYPGSFYNGTSILPFDSPAIALLFGRYNELSIPNVEDLRAGAIPSGKTLTLLGTENAITAAGIPFTLNNNATLIVDGNARLTIAGLITGGAGSAFINRGQGTGKDALGADVDLGVDLGVAGRILLSGPAGALVPAVTNDGRIITTSGLGTLEDDVRTLLAFGGTGTVRTGVDVVLGTTTEPLLLNQNLEIADGTEFTLYDTAEPIDEDSAAGKIITIGVADGVVGATLFLGANSTLIGYLDGTTPVLTRVQNYGVISTPTVVSSTLTNIFSSIVGGTPSRVVEADGIVELDAPFEIPEEITLELADNSTFAAAITGTGVRTLTIKGALSITGTGGNQAALTPPENITIAPTAVVDLGIGSLTIAANKTLDISSSAQFEGTGTLIQVATSTITIDGESGYTFSAPVLGDDFATALADIRDTITNILVDTVTLEDHFVDGDLVIGTVDLSLDLGVGGNPSPLPIVGHPYAGGIGYITVPDGIDITVPPAGLSCLGSPPVFSGTPPTFTLSVIAPSQLALKDNTALPVNPADRIDKFGVLRFTGYTVGKSNLVSPAVTAQFHIGVKSIRNN